MVVELFNHCWWWIDAVVGALCSCYIAQEFLDVDLYNEVGEGSVVVQVLDMVFEATA
jgi:hypothetical protein